MQLPPAFQLLKRESIQEVNSDVLLLEHRKTRAQIVKFCNQDPNKVFLIAFRTHPSDDSGVAHILEHSVLCGSRKYPVKEPFVELLKGSLKTFLNAMTYADKTVYPVASQNRQDYLNLMDVYLDAVFFPNIKKHPEIFEQEGWHYELDRPDGELTYKGVVYNEMKGALSNAEGMLFRSIFQSLYPGTIYGYESGGDPQAIVQLTHEQFCQFHDRFYHPSNAMIVLYGDMDLNVELTQLESYLDQFSYQQPDISILGQAQLAGPVEIAKEYPLSPEDSATQKNYLALSYSIGDFSDPQLKFSFELLEQILMGSEASPLKLDLLKSNIAKDFFSFYHDDLKWPIFSVVAKHIDGKQQKRFLQIIKKCLTRLVKKGIDPLLIESTLNRMEFRLREADFKSYPKGLVHALNLFKSWPYGGDPFQDIRYNTYLAHIKSQYRHGHFEALIERYLLNNYNCSILNMVPVPGLQNRRDAELKIRLQNQLKAWDPTQQQTVIARAQKLLERQRQRDREEDLASIPMLKLSDVATQATVIEQHQQALSDEAVLLIHPQATQGILYYHLYLESAHVPLELIPYYELLTAIWSKVDTRQHTYQELAQEIDLHLGGLSFGCDSFEEYKTQKLIPKLEIRAKALLEKRTHLAQLIQEICRDSLFEDDQRLKEIVQEVHSGMEMMMLDAGQQTAMIRLESMLTPAGYYDELTGGISFYRFIRQLDEEFEERKSTLKQNLYALQALLFNRQGATHSIATDSASLDLTVQWCQEFHQQIPLSADALPSLGNDKDQLKFAVVAKNEAFTVPGQIQYVAQGVNFALHRYPYRGHLRVLRTLLRLDYLWNHVRVQGGAYGAYATLDRFGYLIFASYRDPNLEQTLHVYQRMADYLRNLQLDERALSQYILGTFAEIDFPLTPSMQVSRALSLYFCKVTAADVQQERDEVLRCEVKDLRALADYLELLNQHPCYVVVGNENKIKESAQLFDRVETLI